MTDKSKRRPMVLNARIPHPKVSGRVTLGPKPGTPEFDFEQRCRALGLRYVPPGDPKRPLLERGLAAAAAPDTARSGG